MRRKHVLIAIGGVVVVLVLALGGTFAWLMRARPAFNTSGDGLALSGYDPVAYFPEGGGAPRLGDASFTAEHEGRSYRFASAENRDRFVAGPARYEPGFGGWCAHAVANGYKFEVNPESYLVVDDRLLLFYEGAMGDAREDFQKGGVESGLSKADTNWPALAGAD